MNAPSVPRARCPAPQPSMPQPPARDPANARTPAGRGDFGPGRAVCTRRGVPMYLRCREEVAALFAAEHHELVEPGVVPMQHRRPAEGGAPVGTESINTFAGLARRR
ncbi:SAM-dependent methyltransferase [Streptomyces sp. 3N207]|uniref:SAM-dependent methyltransferase n=1 Tax=Streptomyces sp. 3N207 TaxID=3457417 RepID=UPI003FD27F33